MATASARERGLGRALLLVSLAGLLIRVVALLLEPSVAVVADERTWLGWARIVADKAGFNPFRHAMIFHPPLYAYFLAVPYALAGGFEASKWVQLLAAALVVPAVGRVGAHAFGPRTGLLSAALAAFYPELIWFSFHFWVENLFMLLLWWAFERLMRADAVGRMRPALAAGALWGLAILTRETALYFLPVAALWLARPGWQTPEQPAPSRDGAGARAAAFALAALTVVAPWTYRNHVVFKAFVPVSTAGGQNLFQGNTHIPRDETYVMVDAVKGRIEQYRYARGLGLEAIRARQPTWFLEKLYEQMPMFWEAESMAVIHVKRGAYGEVSPAAATAVAAMALAPYVVVLGFAVVGLAAMPWRRAPLLLLGFLGYYNLLHVVTHGFNRYRLPVMPIVFFLAAFAFSSWRTGSLALRGRRRLAAAVLAVACAASLAPSLRRQWSHEAFVRSHPADAPEPEAPGP